MNRNLVLLFIAAAIGTVILYFAFSGQGLWKDPVAEQAETVVDRALAYMDEHGAAALIEKVNADTAEFREGEAYVFVLDEAGILLAHPTNSDQVGMTAFQSQGPDGDNFAATLVKSATDYPEGSTVHYRRTDPNTGEASEKSVWLVMRDGHIVGGNILSKSE